MFDAGSTGFMLVCAMLVLLMTPGLAFFYGGLSRRKNVVNTMIMSFAVIGIVGGLILGQAAVSASIISPIVIIVVALTGLGNFVIPDYGFTVGMTILRIAIILVSALLGLYGLTLAVFALLCHLCSLHSLGAPFMAPVAPFRPHNPDILLRLPIWMQKRLLFLAKKDSWMRKETRK